MRNPEPAVACILVVDDDEMQRMLARTHLERQGHHVVEAVDGEQALAKMASTAPEIVLLDVTMPGLNGFQVCERIREDPATSDVSVLMMTGLDDVKSIDRAHQAGANDFVVKPLNWPIVVRRISYMLHASRDAAALRLSQAKLKAAHRIARLGNWEWDPSARRLSCSNEALKILGLLQSAPEHVSSLFTQVLSGDQSQCETFLRRIELGPGTYETEFRVKNEQGDLRWVHQLAETVVGDHGPQITGAVQDVTDQRQAEARIRMLANYDTLTQMPNRRFLTEQLSALLHQARRTGFGLTLLFMDFDRFKKVNDTLGHPAGDQLLRQIAERLQTVVHDFTSERRSYPAPLAGRFGGDEFVLAVPCELGSNIAPKVASRVLMELRRPFQLQGRDLVAQVSLGIAVFPDDGDDVDTLLRKADTAMYRAKQRGGDGFRFFEVSKAEEFGVEILQLEKDLSEAVPRDQLELHYQPQLTRGNRLFGVEALVRWRHATLGLLAPDRFIAMAEQTGLILPIGDWVLATACKQGAIWARQQGRPIFVSVNISARQLDHPEFVPELKRHLKASGFPAEQLVLELTETLNLTTFEDVMQRLEQVASLGVRLAIDDFGTGYSSFSYLRRLPLHALKIPPAFVTDLPDDSQNTGIVRAILATCRALGLIAMAEGIEKEEQLAFLLTERCDVLQGFLIGKPAARFDPDSFSATRVGDYACGQVL